jgi:hypothetical protein
VNSEFQHLWANFINRLEALNTEACAISAYIDKKGVYGKTEMGSGKLYRVISNGNEKYRSEKEIEEIRRESDSDFILDVPRMQLRYIPIDRKERQEAKWIKINESIYKVLRVGMGKPGEVFGNMTVNRIFRDDKKKIKMADLRGYVAKVTKLIQGGGTKGPYLLGWKAVIEESNTGRGYYFCESFTYIIIEKNIF